MGTDEKIWEYYKDLAERLGRNSDGGQTAFSIYWIFKYYADNFALLNPLTQAFLGAIDPLGFTDTNLSGLNIKEYLVEPDPTPDQLLAIETALKKPVSFIQGPPGTGKSRTIRNIMSCIVNGLNCTVAMVSTNNAAVGVISEEIRKYGDGSAAGAPIAGNLVSNRQELFNKFAELGSPSVKLKEFNKTHNDFEFKSSKENDFGVLMVNNVEYAQFSNHYKAITSTIHSLKKLFCEGPGIQYDYVIVDESSQVNTLLGLVAMTSGKHLVLVGDSNQLPPIIADDVATEILGEHPLVPAMYRIEEDSNGNMPSILGMSMRRFKDVNARVMLREHYRCHPGIIEYCNANVYEKKLNIESGKDPSIDTLEYKVPMKVLWYQGSYCEPVDVGKRENSDITKRNGKQVLIFVKEELPRLLDRIRDKTDTMDSFSVLSPFRGVLMELAEKIEEELKPKDSAAIKVAINSPEEDGGENDNKFLFQTLTVYKSQGREYDVIYLLPAEDLNWERPWSQSRCLINVAVSRAREELRMIVSSALMSERMQKILSRSDRFIPESPDSPENFRFVKKLVDYAKLANDSDSDYLAEKTEWDPDGLYVEIHDPGNKHHLNGIAFDFPESKGGSPVDFGFYQSGIRSIFDAIPSIRRDAREVANEMESPIQCLINAVTSLAEFDRDNMHLYTDVMLCDLTDETGNIIVVKEQIWEMLERAGYRTPEVYRNYQDHMELHIDAVLCDSNKRVVLMIEVDGGFHRYDKKPEKLERQRVNDAAKDQLMKEYTFYKT